MELESGEVLDDLALNNLKIVQNVHFYRFTSDSVLLSRFARAKAGDEVADFCAGSGIVGLHFFGLHPDMVRRVVLFEMQKELADMSRKTIEINNLEGKFSVENCPVQEIPTDYNERFSLILCNPPYEKGGFEKADYRKAVCRKEIFLTLPQLCASAARCLKFGGRFALCHRADRMAEVVWTLHGCGLEPKRLQLVCGKEGEPPYLLLLECVKGGKPGVKVLPMSVNGQK